MNHTQIIGPSSERKKIKIYNSPADYFKSQELENDQNLKEDQKRKQKGQSSSQSQENGLLYSSYNFIYLHQNEGVEDDIQIVSSKEDISSFCINDGKLYHSVGCQIYDSFSRKIVASRNYPVTGLCSYKDVLYDTGLHDSIFMTLENMVVVRRGSQIISLCTHKDKLLDLGEKGEVGESNIYIYPNSKERAIDSFCYPKEDVFPFAKDKQIKSINSLCSHNDDVFALVNNHFIYSKSAYDLMTLVYKAHFLYSHNGTLYAVEKYGPISNVFLDETPMIDRKVSGLCSIPQSLVDKIKEMKKNNEI